LTKEAGSLPQDLKLNFLAANNDCNEMGAIIYEAPWDKEIPNTMGIGIDSSCIHENAHNCPCAFL
jgi:hypothetical protein